MLKLLIGFVAGLIVAKIGWKKVWTWIKTKFKQLTEKDTEDPVI